ncbi:Chromatin-remodeling ATPase INO80 [Frankliniella fusca]|uniref:Chromatin-remodeling ATPase INO80 n=1 Tax=Frankliniella fusca TaxID=407009 RepID=A0AAE1HTR6_9NEOP|nr:Chromatin-remodeling ATPase INO80 [Frankliniella fusca]
MAVMTRSPPETPVSSVKAAAASNAVRAFRRIFPNLTLGRRGNRGRRKAKGWRGGRKLQREEEEYEEKKGKERAKEKEETMK